MEINWLEWFGYLGSLIVLISLLMSSIVKLRWINLVGAFIFATYGVLNGAWPVAFMNGGIVLIDIYFLIKIYRSKDSYKIMPMNMDSQYFKEFLQFYKDDILKITGKIIDVNQADEKFYITRNMVPAGVIMGSTYKEGTLNIELDYAVPQYRDFKIGTFLYEENKGYFKEKGYKSLISFTTDDKHAKYLKKMGFAETTVDGKKAFTKSL